MNTIWNDNITDWLDCFLACLGHALTTAETMLANVLRKAHY
ncbi:hypothetical protein [Fibrella rubiginis]|nr:hypothetical protein [Fibrella rubiginis]